MLAIFIILEKSILWCDLILIRAMVFKFSNGIQVFQIRRNKKVIRGLRMKVSHFLAIKKSHRITISLLNGS